ncbi:MAG: tRNA (guanosine(37)-N1)-methyltransferase TrmD [Nitrospirae bacterium]|nr:tRNA (guanosine(37)-N1)-methyltransferase TrmD [Nitrospirota bacterium]
MRAEIVTLFPEMVQAVLDASILGRAREAGRLATTITNLREFGLGRYRRVDDAPYGGGPGMIFRPEPVFAAVETVLARVAEPCRLILPSPQGRPFTQSLAAELAAEARPLLFLCGHYEGIDERILQGFAFEEVSLGDFVLTGGELPMLAMLDAAARLLPGVLGNADSAGADCFSEAVDGRLKYPQYTRPAVFRGMAVPDVLRSGHHLEIERWQRAEAARATREKRPDLLAGPDAGSAGG